VKKLRSLKKVDRSDCFLRFSFLSILFCFVLPPEFSKDS